jgi:hypothetical protein
MQLQAIFHSPHASGSGMGDRARDLWSGTPHPLRIVTTAGPIAMVQQRLSFATISIGLKNIGTTGSVQSGSQCSDCHPSNLLENVP